MIFQGIWTNIAKKLYILVIFQGGGGGGEGGGVQTLSPPLDPPMVFNLISIYVPIGEYLTGFLHYGNTSKI